uniref:Uncharacterized protein n=1 Tax=Tanacetum cinerariifolium TaxID=118510 RepID=A0A6L2MJE9_TANCI|nr:hypothetical protein [Tanacetum cinerariifolium]
MLLLQLTFRQCFPTTPVNPPSNIDNPILSLMPPISSLPPFMVYGVGVRLATLLSLCYNLISSDVSRIELQL